MSIDTPKNYYGMSFEDLLTHATSAKIMNQVALEILKRDHADFFNRNYEDVPLDSDYFLTPKNPSSGGFIKPIDFIREDEKSEIIRETLSRL